MQIPTIGALSIYLGLVGLNIVHLITCVKAEVI